MEEGLPRSYDERRRALDEVELREETALRLEHAAQVETLQRRIVLDALGAGADVGTPSEFSLT